MYKFEDILGNTEIVSYLKKTVNNEKINHAYIIDGSKGIGKKLLAKTFVKAIACESLDEKPCGKCISCKTFDAGNNPDVIYVAPSKGKYLGVQDIRERLNRDIEIKPYRSNYKIYILTGTERMQQGAQNALLKTIEEPPRYGIIILITENLNSFLPTILSRCIILKLKPLKHETVMKFLTDKGILQDKAETAALYSMGSIGRGLLLASDDNFLSMRETVIQIMTSISEKDLVGVFLQYREFEQLKESINDCLDIASVWFRDVLVAKELGGYRVMQKDKMALIEKQAAICEKHGIISILESLWDAKLKLMQNANFQLTIEIMLIKIRQNIQG